MPTRKEDIGCGGEHGHFPGVTSKRLFVQWTTSADSDEGDRGSGLIVIAIPGIDVISRRSEATLAVGFSKK